MVFILADFWRFKMAIATEDLKKLILQALDRQAAEEKQAALAHKMKMHVMTRQGKYESEDNLANKQAANVLESMKSTKADWNRGYNESWISSVYAILAIAEEMAKMIRDWNPVGQLLREFESNGSIFPVIDLVHESIDKLLYENPPNKALPKLRYHAEIDADGKLKFDSLKDMKRSDGQPMFSNTPDPRRTEQDNADIQANVARIQGRLERELHIGVIVWLDALGYEREPQVDPNTQTQVVNENGQPVFTGRFRDKNDHDVILTSERFKELRDNVNDEDRSLDAMLKGKFDMDFQHYNSPRPGV